MSKKKPKAKRKYMSTRSERIWWFLLIFVFFKLISVRLKISVCLYKQASSTSWQVGFIFIDKVDI